MIKIGIKVNEGKKSISLKVRGHAGSGKKGNDTVCAAASILTYTFAQIVSDSDKANLLDKCRVDIAEGNTVISLVAKTDESYDALCGSLATVIRGYDLLCSNFPKHVTRNVTA